MPDKAWKKFERTVAQRVGGRRLPCDGEKDGVDVDGWPFAYQVKLRRGMPAYLRRWLRGIVSAGRRTGATGVVVWREPGGLVDDSVVVLRLRDWQDLHGPDKEKPALATRATENTLESTQRENQL